MKESGRLGCYEGRKIRVTTEDGCEFVGTARVDPPGYGLHEFGVMEESVLIRGTQIFLSQIRELELLSPGKTKEVSQMEYMELIGELLERPYRIADIFPRRVGRDAPGQYFAVDRYFRGRARMEALHRRMAEVLLRLNCYYDMAVSFDDCETWERNPDPAVFAERLAALSGNQFLRVVFPDERAMIDVEPDDTWMTVYGTQGEMTETVRQLAMAEGFFLWEPMTDD